MTQYQWAEGFRPPKNVSAEALGLAIEVLDEPTPEALFEASKEAEHVLHGHLWSEGDQVWANRARVEECRHIIGGYRGITIVGGKTITFRPVEFLREQGEGRWARMEEIIADDSLHYAYMAEIKRLQQQALNKMETFMLLLNEQD